MFSDESMQLQRPPISCPSLPQSANLASTTLELFASKLRSILSGLISGKHKNSATVLLYLASRAKKARLTVYLPVWAIPFACRDSNALRTLRAMNLMSCLESFARPEAFSASSSRYSNARKGEGSLPWSMKLRRHEWPSNCCKISFSRCMRISGAHLSTTWFRAVALDVSVYLKWHRRLMLLLGEEWD